ncbi:hypothetical protein LJR219_000551 [Phenylobacterium sp. LjRoot219]|uniref:hypothetical protein n=1 Tax=Phenylobacterium sp. LjRoot219 TaxID=3342283 RepID=UPI003ED17519
MSSAYPNPPGGRTALAVAHPGHELRLAKWVELTRPTVFILTSGSRSGDDRSRVDAGSVSSGSRRRSPAVRRRQLEFLDEALPRRRIDGSRSSPPRAAAAAELSRR